MDYLVKVVKQKTQKDVRGNNRAMTRLRRAAEKAKRSLSSMHSTKVDMEGVVDDVSGMDDVLVTRTKFEELNMDLFRSTLKTVKQAIADSGKSVDEIDDIVLVGGSTRIPRVQSLVKDYFGGKVSLRMDVLLLFRFVHFLYIYIYLSFL